MVATVGREHQGFRCFDRSLVESGVRKNQLAIPRLCGARKRNCGRAGAQSEKLSAAKTSFSESKFGLHTCKQLDHLQLHGLTANRVVHHTSISIQISPAVMIAARSNLDRHFVACHSQSLISPHLASPDFYLQLSQQSQHTRHRCGLCT